MADNFDVTAGTGTTIRAVEKTSKKAQVVVLDLGGAGAESLLTTTLPVSLATNTPTLATGSNAIGKLAANSGVDIGDVDVTSIAAGENHLGMVGGNATVVTVTPTLTVHATYAAGDYVGESATPMTFAACARVNGGTGKITGAVLIDYALQSVPCELWLFDQTVTPPNDSAAWSISDADALKCCGVIPFTVYYASALNSVSPASNLSIPFKIGSAAVALFGCLVTRGAPAYASGDVSVRLFIDQD